MKHNGMHEMKWSTTWSDLPDPRAPNAPFGPLTKIRISEDFWRHIEKHLLHEEKAWDEVLGATLRRRIIQAIGQEETGPWHDVFHQASDLLESQCRSALWRPLLIRFSHRSEEQAAWNQRWLLILPVGAVAIVRSFKHHQGEEWRLVTVFFDSIGRAAKADRWRASARKQFDRYRLQMPGYFTIPSSNHEYVISQPGKQRAVHRKVRLVSPEQWGVHEEGNIAKWVPKWKAWPDVSQKEMSFPDNVERYL